MASRTSSASTVKWCWLRPSCATATGSQSVRPRCFSSPFVTRVLIGSPAMRPTQLEYSVASAAIRGARPYQEDSTKVWSRDCGGTPSEGASTVLAVLADGMGGHVSGEIASGIACTEYVEHFGARSG